MLYNLRAWYRTRLTSSVNPVLSCTPIFGPWCEDLDSIHEDPVGFLGMASRSSMPCASRPDGGNRVVKARSCGRERVLAGRALGSAQDSGVFPPWSSKWSSRRRPGRAPHCWRRWPTYYETKSTWRCRPDRAAHLLIVFLGVVIGGIVIAIYLPIFKVVTLVVVGACQARGNAMDTSPEAQGTVGWLVHGRTGFVSLLAAALVGSHLSGLPLFPFPPSWRCSAATYLLSAVYLALLGASESGVARQIQIYGDVILDTILIYLTGGPYSVCPFLPGVDPDRQHHGGALARASAWPRWRCSRTASPSAANSTVAASRRRPSHHPQRRDGRQPPDPPHQRQLLCVLPHGLPRHVPGGPPAPGAR